MSKKVLLSIALLASNRKDTIEKCLKSLTPIREAIPCELIVVDTGCEKEQRELIETYADIVGEFEWVNDFSKARNETLRYATGEWFLYIDDDEWFVDTSEIIQFFRSGEYKKYGYASYIQRNFLDMEGTQYSDTWVSRMIRLDSDTHFVSKIHEYMEPMHGDCKGLRSIVHHFGYVYETEEALWKHYERNRVLLEEMIAEEPDNLRWRMQLAQEFRTVREYEKLYELGEQSLTLTEDATEMYAKIARGAFHAAKIIAKRETGELEEAIALCKEVEQEKGNTQLFATFLSFRKAQIYYFLGEYELSEACANEYLKWKTFWEENEPLLFLQKMAPFVADCLDIVMQKEIYSILICAGLKQNSTQNLGMYLAKLEWEEDHLYVFEDIVPTLIEAMITMEWEELFEETVLLMQHHTPLWDYFCEEVERYHEAGHEVSLLVQRCDAIIHAPSKEMQQLAIQVKGQIRMLMDNDMMQEAKAIIEQVQKMLPNDKELAELKERC